VKIIEKMSAYRDTDGIATPEQMETRRLLFQIGQSLIDTNEFRVGFTGELTTPDGITYRIKKYDEINCHRQCRLLIEFEGKKYGTALIYSFGDLKIHSNPERLL
jgi:hypothetical protein